MSSQTVSVLIKVTGLKVISRSTELGLRPDLSVRAQPWLRGRRNMPSSLQSSCQSVLTHANDLCAR